MEDRGENTRSIAVRTSLSCVPAIVPVKKQPPPVRKIASGCVFWIGLALIGMIAILAGFLFGILYLIVWLMNFLIDKIEKD